ncbi:MAG: hypothetical protein H6632_08155 [Anaerolineales bacterium]|nr:hypothetical protein [Anaerolineales bacterium]
MYTVFSFIKRIGRFWRKPADVPRRCIFDDRYGCIIPPPVPTQSLGTTFDLQAMANNCGYAGVESQWWHVHHSAPAFQGGMAQSCPHSYRPGHIDNAKPCKCQQMDFWQDKIKAHQEADE